MSDLITFGVYAALGFAVVFALGEWRGRRRVQTAVEQLRPDIRLSARREGVRTYVDLAEDITADEMIAVSLVLSRDGWLRAWAEQGADDAERWLADGGAR